MDPYKALTTHIEAKEYLAQKEIPQLFESMLTGLMYSRPADPLEYLEECINKTKEAGVENIMWDTFALKKDPLPPIPPSTPQQEQPEAPLTSPTSQAPSSLNPFITLPPIANQSVEEDTIVAEASNTATGLDDASLPPQAEKETVNPTVAVEEEEIVAAEDSAQLGLQDSTLPSDATLVFAKLPVVFVTGGPGSGKGTQCDKIVASFNFTHLSSGDLLRAKVASGSADGQELDAIMKAGKLVPLEKVLDLITEAMVNAVNNGNCKGFLIDGYPREIDQGIKFEERIKPCSLVIDFDVPDEVMVQRLIKRGETSGRLDDNEETIRARLQTYREATVPVAAHYEKQCKLARIDANRSVDEVFADVQTAFRIKGICTTESFSQPIFFIVGGPGSGKGTQCEKMVAEFSFTHLSSGDLLRAEVASGSPKGQELQAEMAAGKLISMETVLGLMKSAMEKLKNDSKGYLIDGYPRNVEQGQKFEQIVSPCAACISFDVPSEVMKVRLMKRGETSGRVDDNEATIQKRLVTFENETKPVLQYYKQQGKLNAIDANRSPDEIYQDVRAAITKFVKSG